MKFFLSTTLLLFVFLSFSSCNGGEETAQKDEKAKAVDYYDFEGMSLKKYEIPVLIMLPGQTSNVGAAVEPKVIHTEGDYKWEIKIGPNFTLLIEDYGREKNLVQREKKRLADFPFYKIEYLTDTDSLLFYKRILKYDKKGNSDVGVDHITFHCYAVKEINGINYVFESPSEGYHKPIIETMVKTINSVEKL